MASIIPSGMRIAPRVHSVTFDWGNRVEHSVESDNWSPTWHDDGLIYCCYGDGYGLGSGTASGDSSLGIAQFSSFPTTGGAVNRWGGRTPRQHDSTWENNVNDNWDTYTNEIDPIGGTAEAKSYGVFSYGGNMWMLCGAGSLGSPQCTDVRIAKSTDDSLTWTLATAETWVHANKMSFPGFLQCGQGGTELYQDGYLYIYGQDWSQTTVTGGLVGTKDEIYLARIRPENLSLSLPASAFEYYNGLSGGQPVWSSSVSSKTFVWKEASYGFGLGTGIVWLPWLSGGHVVMTVWGLASNYGGNVTQENRPGRLLIYVSRRPWGPFTQIHNADNFQNNVTATGVGLWYSQIVRKGEDQANKKVWMGYTGWGTTTGSTVGKWDCFGAVQITFITS